MAEDFVNLFAFTTCWTGEKHFDEDFNYFFEIDRNAEKSHPSPENDPVVDGSLPRAFRPAFAQKQHDIYFRINDKDKPQQLSIWVVTRALCIP